MLFPYKRIPHAMEKMHEFIEFIFQNVWCNAPNVDYSIDLFEGNDSLHKVMDHLDREDQAGKLKETGAGAFFLTHVNEIFNEFKRLQPAEITQYRLQFDQNNKIEDLCQNAPESLRTQYESLNPAKTTLNEKIETFFKQLYSSGFFDLKFVKDEVGSTIGEYYRDFVRRDNGNDNDVCPFCGLLPIDGEFDPTREAFDHYLPKGKYPFNSVNLANLCPSCNKCNSGNKLEQDPLHDRNGIRRPAFYPFSDVQPDIAISISVNVTDWTRPLPENFVVSITSHSHVVETRTWSEMFRITKRYAAKCCSKGGGDYWKKKVLDECQNYERSPGQMARAEITTAKSSPWYEANFLKAAFLEGFERKGVFAELV